MLFKNVRAYDLQEAVEIDPSGHEFKPRGKQQLSSMGFVPVVGEELKPVSQGFYFLKLRVDSALLPAKVVNQELADRARKIEQETGTTVARSERMKMKDDVMAALLPRAFTETRFVHIIGTAKRLYINAASANVAEDALGFLRSVTGSLPVNPVNSEYRPDFIFTSWLTAPGDLPDDMVLGYEAVMQDSEGAKVTLKDHELQSEEVKACLNSAKMCTKLALSLRNHSSYVVESDLAIKGVKLAEIDDEPPEDDELGTLLIEADTVETIINRTLSAMEAMKTKEKAA